MITIEPYEGHVYGVTPSKIYGLSTDTKPMDVNNASRFYEMDTGKLFIFCETNCNWIKVKRVK